MFDNEFNLHVLCSRNSGAQDAFGGTLTFAASNIFTWATGNDGTNTFADKTSGLERKLGTTFKKYADASAVTYTDATKSLTKVGAFSTYTWRPFDRVRVNSGTGVTDAVYLIASKVSDDEIRTVTSVTATDLAADLTITTAMQQEMADVFLPWPSLDAGWLEWNVAGNFNGTTNISSTTATWTEATRTLTKTGAFTSYTWAAGDFVSVRAGTGAIVGYVPISAKTDADNIVLATTIGAGADAQTDISFRLFDAEPLTVRMYVQPDTTQAAETLLENPTVLTFPYVGQMTSNTQQFNLRVRLQPFAPGTSSTDASAYQITAEMNYAETSSTAAEVVSQEAITKRLIARGTINLKRDLRYFLTLQKGSNSTTLNVIPRTITVTHFAPRIGA